MNELIFARKTYMGGTLEVLSEIGNPWPSDDAHDVYIARRQGNGSKDGAIVVINNNNSSTKGLWVTVNASGFSNWRNKTLVNAFNSSQTTYVYSDGRAWLEAPARGYAVYVLSTDYVTYTKSATVDIKQINSLAIDLEMDVYPNVTSSYVTIELKTNKELNASILVFDLTGRLVENVFEGKADIGESTYILNLEKYRSGMYIVKVVSQEKEINKRLIVR